MVVVFGVMGGEPRNANPLLGLDRGRAPDEEDEDDARDSGRVARDTVKPAFDVERYAETLTRREPLPTIIDEEATEEARLASVLMDSSPPGGIVAAPVAPLIDVDVEAFDHEEQVAFFRARLAPMTRAPTLVRTITELGSWIEDPKTAYVLGFVDGLLPLETIVEVAGLPELETLRILDRAVEQYVLTFRPQHDLP